jgi:hypothetical protein
MEKVNKQKPIFQKIEVIASALSQKALDTGIFRLLSELKSIVYGGWKL